MPSVNEKKARELAKLSIKMEQQLFIFDGCKKMAKDASPEIKKEIEDFRTERLLDAIKKVGIEQVEEGHKINMKMMKLYKQSDKLRKKRRTAKNIKKNESINRRTTCKYSKKYHTFVSHTGAK